MRECLIRVFVKDFENTKSPAVRQAYGVLAGTVGIAANVLLCAAKLFAGLLTNSISMMADAMNNLSDASSGIITLVGFQLAGKPADREHPYGHARMEYLTGLAACILILMLGLDFAKSSIVKIFNPEPVRFGVVPAAVLGGAIVVKLWLAGFYGMVGRRIESTALLAAAADSRNDMLMTASVLLGLMVSVQTGWYLDGWLGLGVAGFVLYSGAGLLKEMLDPLLGRAPAPELVMYIRKKILSYDGVLGAHDLMVHDYGPGRCFASVHVELSAQRSVLESHDLIDSIERAFHDEDNIHLVIHHDPIVSEEGTEGTLRAWVCACVHTVSPELSIHDLRSVEHEDEVRLMFDVTVPDQLELSDIQVKQRIQHEIERTQPQRRYRAVITVDHSFAPFHQDEE